MLGLVDDLVNSEALLTLLGRALYNITHVAAE
jgi:hypothetical protein